MNLKQTITSRNTRQMRYLVAFMLFLLAASLLYVGCKPENKSGGTVTTQTASPSPTPSPSPSGTPGFNRGDDPIVVTGGSVDVDFKENSGDYEPDPSNPNHFVCTGCQLDYVLIKDRPGGSQSTRCQLGSNSTVTIDARRNTGVNKDVKVMGSSTNVVIDFDKDEYKPGNDSDGRPRKHHNKDNKIQSITFDGKDCKIPPDGVCKKCQVEIHTK